MVIAPSDDEAGRQPEGDDQSVQRVEAMLKFMVPTRKRRAFWPSVPK